MQRDHFARMTVHFLVEGLRTRKLALPRVVEIAEKFTTHINLLNSEAEFLSFVKELSKDFEELVMLENKILHGKDIQDRKKLEQMVREFAVMHLPNNTQLAITILKEASGEKISIEILKSKFPEFKTFAENYA